MLLLPNRVCPPDKVTKILVQILRLFELEMVHVIARRDEIDAVEARPIMPVRQDQMTNYFR